MIDPKKKNRRTYTGATPKRGWDGSDPGSYNNAAAPRVGGPAPKSSGRLRSASKRQLRTAKKIRRQIGTGRSVTQPRY